MIKTELKNIRQSKMLLVTTIAICCIPVLYAVVFLKEMSTKIGRASCRERV